MSTTQNVTGAVTLLYGTQGSGNSTMLIVNLDSTNTVWVNESSQVQFGGPVGVPVQPGASISMTATQGLWAVAAPGESVQVALIPNGTSYFFPASLSNLGGAKVYVQATAPAGTIPANSIWFNTTTKGIETYTGGAWDNQQLNAQTAIVAASILGTQIAAGTITGGNVANGTLTTAQLAAAAGILGSQIASATITSGNIAANTIVAGNIAANTITASQLAANIIVAGIVNGTTITGATLIGDGSGIQFLIYNGTPAANNLVLSQAVTPTTDSFHNQIPAGLTSYSATQPGAAQNVAWGGITSCLQNASGLSSQQGAWNFVADYWQDQSYFYTDVPLVAQEPGGAANTPETPHNLTLTTPANWTVNTQPTYMLEPDGTVSIEGEITAAAAIGDGATLATLTTTAYQPSAVRRLTLNYNSGSPVAVTAVLASVSTGGAITTYPAIPSGATLNISARFRL